MGKSEKEKMLSGLMYNAYDKEIARDRKTAKSLIIKYNKTKPNQTKKRNKILNILFKKQNVNIEIEPPFYCDYGYNIDIGNNFYANHNCIILDINKIKIGSYVFLGPNVQIYAVNHPLDPKDRNKMKEIGKPVTICDNVWIGGNSVICPGVTIGKNSTIGAGSVVVKDIPENVVAVGNPCKIVKKLINLE